MMRVQDNMPWRQAQQPLPELRITGYLRAQSKHTPARKLLSSESRRDEQIDPSAKSESAHQQHHAFTHQPQAAL